MNGSPRAEIARRFFSGTGPTYDRIVRLCTLGFDGLWKKKILAEIPEGSSRILDQACGTGILTFQIAERFPLCQVTGVDMTEEYLEIARGKLRSRKMKNVEFISGRAEDILLASSFDCITSSYLGKYADLERLISNIRKMLRPGGTLIMHDFTYPAGHSFSRLWESYFRILQIGGGWRYPQWKIVFYELPGFLRQTRWVEELVQTLRANSFREIRVQSLTFGTSAIATAVNTGPRYED